MPSLFKQTWARLTQSDNPSKIRSSFVDATILEDRILFSAAPLDATPIAEEPALASLDESTHEAETGTDNRQGSRLVVVDSGLDDVQKFLDDMQRTLADSEWANTELMLLDVDSELADISDVLSKRVDWSEIHLVTHGDSGRIEIGDSELSLGTLAQNAKELSSWKSYLAAEADIIVYGCDVASGPYGEQFVSALAEFTDADIAASNDRTGHVQLDGDWQLEYHVGTVTSSPLFSENLQATWTGTLDITSNLVAHFEFDSDFGTTAVDSSPTANDGVWQNGLLLDANGAADFRGDTTSNRIVSVPDNAAYDFGNGDFTVSLWYSMATAPSGQLQVLFSHEVFGEGISFLADSVFPDFVWTVDGSLGSTALITSLQTGNVWQLMTATRSGNTFSLYENGVLVDSVFAPVGSISPPAPIVIGAFTEFGNDYEGLIDDVRIYDRALSVADIAELYNVGQSEEALVSNASLNIAAAASGVISNALLNTTDAEQSASEIEYTISKTTSAGTLFNGATPLGMGDTFTQSDIDGGAISYSHAGVLPYDDFAFSVDDGFGSSTSGKFNIFASGTNVTPFDLLPNATSQGGLSLNNDGGNDGYLIAEDGGEILGGLTAFTFEMQYSSTDDTTASPFVSYAVPSDANHFLLERRASGSLAIGINGTIADANLFDFDLIADGEAHTVSFTWDNTAGDWELFIDGTSVESGTGLAVGHTMLGDGALVFGQEQDSLNGGFDSMSVFSGTIFDARFFSDVRTSDEIAQGHNSTLPFYEDNLVANWRFSDITQDGIVTDAVSANNLLVHHATGAGFVANTPTLEFWIAEDASNGTVVGSVHGIDAEREALIQSLLVNGTNLYYLEDANAFVYFESAPSDWDTAQTLAVASTINGSSGQLATIGSANENKQIRLAAIDLGLTGIWLGGSDQNVEGEWRWYDDGVVGVQFADASGASQNDLYTNFGVGEPSGGATENHLEMDVGLGSWNDLDGTASVRSYAVEFDSDDVLDGGPAGQALMYSIVSQSVAGAFAVDPDNGEITVADGSLLDRQALAIHTVRILVQDVDGNTYEEDFDIQIGPANALPTSTSFMDNQNEEAVAVISLSANDPDGTVVAFQVTNIPADGVLYLDAGLTTPVVAATPYPALSESLQLFFQPNQDFNGTTSFDYIAQDNAGAWESTPATITIEYNPINDAPVWGSVTSIESYTENFPSVILQPTITVFDADLTNFDGGTLTIDRVSTLTADELSIVPDSNVTITASDVSVGGLVVGTYSGGTGGTNLVVTFNASATASHVEAVARRVGFEVPGENIDPNNRELDFILTDGDSGTSSAVRSTVFVTPVNDAPTIDLDADDSSGALNDGYATSFVAGGAATYIADPTDAVLSDVDNGSLTELIVTISNPFDGPNEVLWSDVSGTNISAIYDTATNVLSLTGIDTVANYEQVLRTIQYENTSPTPDLTTRIVDFVVDDGTDQSNVAQTSITMFADAFPPNHITNGGLIVPEGGTQSLSTAELEFADLQNSSDITYSLTTNLTNGHLALAATPAISLGSFTQSQIDNGDVIYVHNGSETTSDSFDFIVSDSLGNTSGVDTFVISVTPTNDAPVVNLDPTDLNFTEQSPIGVDINGTIVDVDSPFLTSAVIQISANFDPSDVLVFQSTLTITGNWDASLGTLTLTGNASIAEYQTALQSVTFNNTSDTPNITTRTISVSVNDGELESVAVSRNIVVNAANDAPQATNDTYSVDEDSALVTFVGVNDLLLNDFDVDGDLLSVNTTPIVGPSNGTLLLNTDGTFTYTPNTNFNGVDSFTYEATDGQGGTGQATVAITVNAINDIPVASNDSFTTNENTTYTSTLGVNDLLINDTDLDGDLLTLDVTPVSGPLNGSLALNADGTFTYSPNLGFVGNDAFTYRVSDGNGGTAEATVTITVLAGSTSPVAGDDAFVMFEDTTLDVDVFANDFADDLATATAELVSLPSNGTAVLLANGRLTYAPNANFNGTDVLVYKLTDSNGGTAQATVVLTVNAVNDAPVAQNDFYSTPEDSPFVATVGINGLVANDTDVDSNTLVVNTTPIANPNDGVLSLASDGSFVYTPNRDFNGVDAFIYEVVDENGATDQATATISVSAINDSPVAMADEFNLTEGGNITGTLLGNDFDADLDLLTTSQTSGPAHGILTLLSDGTFQYQHDGSETIVDSFEYSVSDGIATSTAVVTLNVAPVNDTPVTVADSYQVLEGDTLLADSVLTNDTDAENDILTATLLVGPAHGTVALNADGTFEYIHDGSETTADSFEYVATDGNATSSAIVTIAVTPVNDAPVAVADSYQVLEGDILVADSVLANDIDAENDILTATLLVGPAHGTVALNADGTFEYIHDGSETTADAFEYVVTDGNATSSTIVTIAVTPVNDAPNAVADSYQVLEGDTLLADSVLANDTDAENDNLSATLLDGPTHGTLEFNSDGTFAYAHDGSETATDTFTYAVSDLSGAQNAATVTLDVLPVNDAPTSSGPTNLTTLESVPVEFSRFAGTGFEVADADAFENQVLVTLSASNGTVNLGSVANLSFVDGTGNGDSVLTVAGTLDDVRDALEGMRYQPTEKFVGTATLALLLDDQANSGAGGNKSTSSVVNITVVPDSAPVSESDFLIVSTGDTLLANVLNNDRDAEDDVLSSALVSGPEFGEIELQSDGTLTYTANAGYIGTDTFAYITSDGNSLSQVTQVTISVTLPGINIPIIPPPSQLPGGSSSSSSGDGESSNVAATLNANASAAALGATFTSDSGASEDEDSSSNNGVVANIDEREAQRRRVFAMVKTSDRNEAVIDIVAKPTSRSDAVSESATLYARQLAGAFDRTDVTVDKNKLGPNDIALVREQPVVAGFFPSEWIWDRMSDVAETLKQNNETLALGATLQTATATVASLGYVLWSLRSTYPIASTLSTVPAWQRIDPIPILGAFTDKNDLNMASNESLMQGIRSEYK